MLLGTINDPSGYQWGVVIGASLVAAVVDVLQRRIPNFITLPVAVGAVVYSLFFGNIGDCIGAMLLLMAPYLLLFLFAGGGAGDAKMMGAIGAWLGFEAGLVVLVAVAVTGAVFGALNLVIHGQLRKGAGRIATAFYVTMAGLCVGPRGWSLLRSDVDLEPKPQDPRLTIAYGPAIFIGVCIGAFVVHLWKG